MVNTEDFIKRLEIILDYYSLNASGFADKIGVQRSSLSHLLSGRNKPSLDFILKILDVFPDVDLYWILNGKGSFPKNLETIDSRESIFEEEVKTKTPTPISEAVIANNLFSEINNNEIVKSVESPNYRSPDNNIDSNSPELEKIVFFYKNGTFKTYTPN
ncbi:helix-turn-helix transcriptional regulator [Flavobacterium sp. K5-23]|uniref:helix-turn-helix domain-containing protein n=1 Tax=Flavobacterium sp. K5-23 TaxID=2746225 RepID=UPI00200EC714|nr:helix-turn-helix transcriptional regulator [Flavobacterium sp. K5-23]UQD57060.1 helix-turn-helix transcriptional regulator [Flavobacterium sp. K5-23]